jgi:ATP synthase protein I
MSEQDDQGASFEARLRSARSRQGLDPLPQAERSGGNSSALGVGMRAGVEVVAALVVAIAIGWGLDHWLHTLPLFLIIFAVLGGAAGIVNVWRLVGPGKRN